MHQWCSDVSDNDDDVMVMMAVVTRGRDTMLFTQIHVLYAASF